MNEQEMTVEETLNILFVDAEKSEVPLLWWQVCEISRKLTQDLEDQLAGLESPRRIGQCVYMANFSWGGRKIKATPEVRDEIEFIQTDFLGNGNGYHMVKESDKVEALWWQSNSSDAELLAVRLDNGLWDLYYKENGQESSYLDFLPSSKLSRERKFEEISAGIVLDNKPHTIEEFREMDKLSQEIALAEQSAFTSSQENKAAKAALHPTRKRKGRK